MKQIRPYHPSFSPIIYLILSLSYYTTIKEYCDEFKLLRIQTNDAKTQVLSILEIVNLQKVEKGTDDFVKEKTIKLSSKPVKKLILGKKVK